jgi:hypothetical protein
MYDEASRKRECARRVPGLTRRQPLQASLSIPIDAGRCSYQGDRGGRDEADHGAYGRSAARGSVKTFATRPVGIVGARVRAR